MDVCRPSTYLHTLSCSCGKLFSICGTISLEIRLQYDANFHKVCATSVDRRTAERTHKQPERTDARTKCQMCSE